jgi:6-phosphogluconolactonase (cycloisomerase 2 family)
MDPFKTAAARAAILSLVLLFSACGGGGGGSPTPPATFTVGGAVSGLAGNSVALRLNGGADFLVTTNGNFTFPGAITSGTAYTITVQTQPTGPTQTCALTNASGTITANVTNIMVNCTTNTYRVSGTLAGLAGGGVVLRNNGGDDLTLSANGIFHFATAVASGGAYAVTVQAQPLGPSQTCVVSQGAGNVVAADITNVTVNCTTNTFSISGTISGLNGTGVVLRNNGGNDLTVNANGSFTFSAPVVSGNNYLVTVLTQPTAPFQRCTVANAGGTVLAANITSVTITCVNLYSIGGTVNGLDVAGLVLRNSGGDDLTITANGTFSFATRVPPGTTYTVTAVADTPASPRHVCQIVNGTGTVNTSADVTNVEVTCEADRFAYVAHFSPGGITVLTADHQTGALAPIAGTSMFATGAGAVSIVSDPRGRFVYVANANANTVSGYRVNAATGALTPVPGSPFAAGSLPRSLAIDSEGLFLYAANLNSDNVHGWAIQADGSLSAVPGSPFSTGSASGPISVATSPAGQCCYVYVAHSLGAVAQLSAFAYQPETGALTPVAGSPYSLPNAYTPSSVLANNTGELVYMAASGTSNITTFDIAGGIGGGVLTERSGSPTPLGNAPCEIQQPRLSPSLFAVSGLSYQLMLLGNDPNTFLPTLQDVQTMFVGSYCSLATDPYGKFVYVPKIDADYLFGYSVGTGGSALQPLPLNPLPPQNTYTLPASQPRAMVLRYSRRDREMLHVPE